LPVGGVDTSFAARIVIKQKGISDLPSIECMVLDEIDAFRFVTMVRRWDKAQAENGIRTRLFHQSGSGYDGKLDPTWQQFEFWSDCPIPTLSGLLAFDTGSAKAAEHVF
jgi:hypothetical protein